MYNLMELLNDVAAKKASDLHLVVGLPPMMRLDTIVKPMGKEKLTAEETKQLIYSVLNERQIKKFEESCELDASFPIQSEENSGRVRLNIFRQQGNISAALRFIPQKTYTFEELHLSQVVYEIVNLQKGLVLVTGATGSGKTTTLA